MPRNRRFIIINHIVKFNTNIIIHTSQYIDYYTQYYIEYIYINIYCTLPPT